MEIEVKFSPVSAGIAKRILSELPFFTGEQQELDMHSVYYDCADGALRGVGSSLRLRRENDRTVCCLKYDLGGIRRFEAEEQAQDICGGIAALCKRDDVPQKIKSILSASLPQPVFFAEFRRVVRELRFEDMTAELSYDRGRLGQQNRYMPLSEMECELKNGSERSLHSFTALLCSEYGLTVCKSSKAKRAAALTKAFFDTLTPLPDSTVPEKLLYSGKIFYTAGKVEKEYFTV